MPMSPSLQNQIAAIQAAISNLAPTATPEDVVMLAKAVEAIAGQTTVFDLQAFAASLGDGLDAKSVEKLQALANAATQAIAAITAAKTTAIENITAYPVTLATLHSLTLAL